MRWRDFIKLIASSAATWPLAARALRALAAVLIVVLDFVVAVDPSLAQQCTTPSPCAGPLTNLGILTGTTESRAFGVNNDGSVVVGGTAKKSRAFRWTTTTQMQDLGTLGGPRAIAQGVSANGQVLVGSSTKTSDFIWRAFRWERQRMRDLGTLGGDNSYAYSVSGDGYVVVGKSETMPGYQGLFRAFRWTRNTQMKDLGSLGGPQSNSIASATNNDGSVVVGGTLMPLSTDVHAFRWTSVGGMVDLGTLGGKNSYAHGVSSDGSVVVGQSDTSDGAIHAFRWSAATQTMEDLGTLGGALSIATGTNSDGSVIVGCSSVADGKTYNGSVDIGCGVFTTPSSATPVQAFHWTAATNMKDLNKLLSDVGVNVSWTLVVATGVSANGRFIVGYWQFHDPNSQEPIDERAFRVCVATANPACSP